MLQVAGLEKHWNIPRLPRRKSGRLDKTNPAELPRLYWHEASEIYCIPMLNKHGSMTMDIHGNPLSPRASTPEGRSIDLLCKIKKVWQHWLNDYSLCRRYRYHRATKHKWHESLIITITITIIIIIIPFLLSPNSKNICFACLKMTCFLHVHKSTFQVVSPPPKPVVPKYIYIISISNSLDELAVIFHQPPIA